MLMLIVTHAYYIMFYFYSKHLIERRASRERKGLVSDPSRHVALFLPKAAMNSPAPNGTQIGML